MLKAPPKRLWKKKQTLLQKLWIMRGFFLTYGSKKLKKLVTKNDWILYLCWTNKWVGHASAENYMLKFNTKVINVNDVH